MFMNSYEHLKHIEKATGQNVMAEHVNDGFGSAAASFSVEQHIVNMMQQR